MKKNVRLYDKPPTKSSARIDWDPVDEIAITLIDNPGKWALLLTRENPNNRATVTLKARYGSGFVFTTRVNENGEAEVWASYQPTGEGA